MIYTYDRINVNRVFLECDFMKKNRAVLFVLLFSILLSMFSFNSAAFTDDEEVFIAAKQPELYGAYNDVTQSKGILASVVDIEEIKDYLLENISQCNAIVDISGFGIPINYYTYLSDYIFYYHQFLFYIPKRICLNVILLSVSRSRNITFSMNSR